jgi:hypothetical protein
MVQEYWPERLRNFDVDNGQYEESFPVQENNVTADEHVLAIARRRRQAPHQLFGARTDFPTQAGRELSALDELALEAGRQAVALGKTGRQAIPAAVAMLALTVITANGIAVMIIVTVTGIAVVAFVLVFLMLVFFVLVFVAFVFAILRQGAASGQEHG